MLGTFHFRERGFDTFAESTQAQLCRIAQKIVGFNPDAVAVEVAKHQQQAVDNSFSLLSLDDYNNKEKMLTSTLGKIHLWGREYDIPYNAESIQIGYRVGKMQNHDTVYAIDDDTELIDIDPTLVNTDRFNMYFDRLNFSGGYTDLEKLFHFMNTDEWSANNHKMYLETNKIILPDGTYIGAEQFSQWYKRNLKIFCNLQMLARKHKRIFVLYGAGHLSILRDLINTYDEMTLLDTNKVLFD